MISDQEYLKIADEAYDEALEIVRSSDGWKVEKEDKENNVLVEMKKNKNGKKIYRCKVSTEYKMWGSSGDLLFLLLQAPIKMPAKLLIESIQDTDNICNWNKTLTTSKVLKRLNDNVGITHQVR